MYPRLANGVNVTINNSLLRGPIMPRLDNIAPPPTTTLISWYRGARRVITIVSKISRKRPFISFPDAFSLDSFPIHDTSFPAFAERLK